MEARGRGAGINKPAWLVQKEREEAAAAAASGGDNNVKVENGSENNTNGGTSSEIKTEKGEDNNTNGKFDDAPNPDQPTSSYGGGGGGGGYDERDQFGRNRASHGGGSSRDYYDNRRGGDYRGGGGRRDYDDRRGGRDYDRRDDRRRGGGRRDRRRGGNSGIYFHSYEEERDWIEERRHKRRNRRPKFDVEPTPEQLAEDEARLALEQTHTLGIARTNVGATGANMGINLGRFGSGPGIATQSPQQTRHARRIYVGNVPDISEGDLQNFFRDRISSSVILDPSNPSTSSWRKQYVENDPIISVYINRERRFAFLEFKTMEITTACLSLDGLDIMGRGKVKVKRPNDYNAALAPVVNAETAVKLDTSKLGIVSPTVPDGPNKIFIGGLPYHLTEGQVLELLGAFGTVKAFHLVKQDAAAMTSKGYCFVEYSDPNITQVATMGLNGMDMGGGKQLSCKLASQQYHQQQGLEVGGGVFNPTVAAPPVAQAVIDGVDVNDLLSAALGGGALPGMNPIQPNPMMAMPQQQQPQVLDPMAVANAAASALDAAFGGGSAPVPQPVQQQPTMTVPTSSSTPTRVLVLLNMVMDEDLASEEDHKMLAEEVREEVSKYGQLLSIKIPRPQDGYAPSAIKKIFLEYASPNDAMSAEKELKGRAFGPNVVDCIYFQEDDYAKGNLS